MNRRERRAQQRELEKLNSGNGYGLGLPNSRPATGSRPSVNPFAMPKQTGLNVTSNNFYPSYLREWTPAAWRLACDQALKMAWAQDYYALVTWVYGASSFVQGLFIELNSRADNSIVYLKDEKGNPLDVFNEEVINTEFFQYIKREYWASYMWGYTALNIDWDTQKIFKYAMNSVDQFNKMVRKDNYNPNDATFIEGNPYLAFIQPNTSMEGILGYMQPISRDFILINENNKNQVQAGRKSAYPFLTVGYEVNNMGLDANGNENNIAKANAEEIIEKADPSKGIAYPMTRDAQGNVIKALEIEHTKGTQGTTGAHKIYSDFNEIQKRDIMIMVLGETLTSTTGASGSLSLGQIHQETKEKRIKATNTMMVAWLNREILPKMKQIYKYLPEGAKFDIDCSRQWKISDIVDISPVLNQNGLKLSESFFEKIGLTTDDLEAVAAPQPIEKPQIQQKQAIPKKE